MIKIAHESPKGIFKEVQKFTDYDYALVHLFEEDKEYWNQFKEAALNLTSLFNLAFILFYILICYYFNHITVTIMFIFGTTPISMYISTL